MFEDRVCRCWSPSTTEINAELVSISAGSVAGAVVSKSPADGCSQAGLPPRPPRKLLRQNSLPAKSSVWSKGLVEQSACPLPVCLSAPGDRSHTRGLSIDSTFFDTVIEPVLSQRRRPGRPARVAAIMRDKLQPSRCCVGQQQESTDYSEFSSPVSVCLDQLDQLPSVDAKVARFQQASDLLMEGLLSETVSDILSTY